MPQNRKGPRLWLNKRSGRAPIYQIRDGSVIKSTGCGEADLELAKEALAKYIETERPTLPRNWTGEAVPQPNNYILYYITTFAVPDYPIKIGRAFNDVHARLAAIQTANPYPLIILAVERGSGALERMVHIDFHAARLEGEWFRRTPELMAHIHKVMTDMPLIYRSIEGFDSVVVPTIPPPECRHSAGCRPAQRGAA